MCVVFRCVENKYPNLCVRIGNILCKCVCHCTFILIYSVYHCLQLRYIVFTIPILGNHEELQGVRDISIHYASSGESYDHRTTIIDTQFSATIADNLLMDLDPKTMAECR
jgi:hypothetical protein